MRAYVAELDRTFPERFDVGSGFEEDELAQMAAPNGRFIVVDDDGETLGCGGLRRVDDATCEIKRMWLDPSMRGLGLGRRVLDHLERHGRELGYDAVVLDTHSSLDSAIALYDSAGYSRIDRYNDNPYAKLFFRKDLTG
jgi:ribosomal protein S18 acetylase RimI-like enzyme